MFNCLSNKYPNNTDSVMNKHKQRRNIKKPTNSEESLEHISAYTFNYAYQREHDK